MENYRRNSKRIKSGGRRVQEMCGCSEEKLTIEYDAALQLDDSVIPAAPAGESEIIWIRIMNERLYRKLRRNSKKVVRGRFGWKRLAAVGVLACVLTGSGCFVSMATKSYFYREVQVGSAKVLVNDTYLENVYGEEDAYIKIETELKIKPMRLMYIPKNMKFNNLEFNDGQATMFFDYPTGPVVLTQTKYDMSSSFNHKTDLEYDKSIYNKWINKKISISQEPLSDGTIRFESSVALDEGYYTLLGVMEEEEFKKIVEWLSF